MKSPKEFQREATRDPLCKAAKTATEDHNDTPKWPITGWILAAVVLGGAIWVLIIYLISAAFGA